MSDKKKFPPVSDPDATVTGPLRPPGPDLDATINGPLRLTEVDFDVTETGPLVPPPAKAPAADDPDATFSGPLTQFDPDATVSGRAGGRRRNPFAPKALPEALQANLAALGGLNPLIAFANPIFSAVPQIGAARNHPDPVLLKETLQDLVEAFEAGASKSGASTDTVAGAVYALCCLADDAAASTPWGRDWMKNGLLQELRGENNGGEEFFALLAEKQKQPEENASLLEFLYICLSLGFQGRYRDANGDANGDAAKSADLDRIRSDLHAVVSRRRAHPSSLSEQWRPTKALPAAVRARKPAEGIAWRMIAVPVSALLVLLIAYKLYKPGEPQPVTPPVAPAPPVTQAPSTTPVAAGNTQQVLEKELAPEIKGALVKLGTADGRTTITLLDDKQFALGSVEPTAAVKALVERVAGAIERTNGPVLVRGHTDSVPVKPGAFASNVELSASRAKAAAALLAARLTQPQRVTSEGTGEANPIAPNDTPENRAKNRRIQIIAGPGQ